jgi:hypothetical protein
MCSNPFDQATAMFDQLLEETKTVKTKGKVLYVVGTIIMAKVVADVMSDVDACWSCLITDVCSCFIRSMVEVVAHKEEWHESKGRRVCSCLSRAFNSHEFRDMMIARLGRAESAGVHGFHKRVPIHRYGWQISW